MTHPSPVNSCRAARVACAVALFAAPMAVAATGQEGTKATDDAKAGAMAALDARYAIGPGAADDFGCRIVWQSEPLATKDARVELITPSADSVWLGDSAGSIVRMRRDTGETVWRSSTFQGTERMLALEYLPAARADNVYVVTELGSVALDAVTGNLVRRSKFAHLPSTTPAVYGSAMIFGTGTGLASWFQYASGYNWRATTLGGRLQAPITVANDLAIAASTNGTVLALDASSAAVRWSRKLSAGVQAQPAADSTTCFVAGDDQSLWAFDLQRGRVLWQYFTQSALRNPPTRIADGLYLQIPGEGLVSFNPLPNEKPDGEVRWKSAAPGNVIARMGTNIMAWDAPTRTLSAVDAGTGRVVRQAAFPKVECVRFSPAIDGDLFVATKNGAVERLEPLGRRSGAASVTDAAPPAAKSAPAAGGAAPAGNDAGRRTSGRNG